MMKSILAFLVVAVSLGLPAAVVAGEFALQLRSQQETEPESGRYHRLTESQNWDAAETAVIVCDVWDYHHCLNAVRRVNEFGPRLNKLVQEARRRGAVIIHAPSDCMPAYAEHPARLRATSTPIVADAPADIERWCSRIPSEEQGVYPIDQSNGGEDDDPAEHARWREELIAKGRNPNLPWERQSDLIEIDSAKDYVSDRGPEVWSILQKHGVKNVILAGVHTNMCVLGRPFGLRQMAKNGKNVVLLRDMTDTMYDPQRWPYVSHFTGNDLIVSHVERHVCPTISSEQILGGNAFRFQHDQRPRLVIMSAEDEYETERTLPEFAAQQLGKHFSVSYLFGDANDRNLLPGAEEALADADVLLVSVRRRALPPAQLDAIRQFVAAGKPVVGIRTASHAFSLRGKPAPEGTTVWPEFDAQVFGGSYTNHYGNQLKATVRTAPGADKALLQGVANEFPQAGSLYKAAPLAKGAATLLIGEVDGEEPEPVAWTFHRADGGRSFYTSLGAPGDFENASFVRLLVNGLHWAAGLPIEAASDATAAAQGGLSSPSKESFEKHWTTIKVPSSWEAASGGVLRDYDGPGWYRCAVQIPKAWLAVKSPLLTVESYEDNVQAWCNGQELVAEKKASQGAVNFRLPAEALLPEESNLIVLRIDDHGGDGGLVAAPFVRMGQNSLRLKGDWEFRIGNDRAWSAMPLPARFGASPDILFEP
ncbi:isochorismatase family protein [Lignipirellula cremea]|uniref:Trehalose utilization n=1 Tax=Lignipirellula cremea TaxID=2528010 RepID=A0A518DXB5_9BACT|nr:isochorismatase family protein [Lignipirellula cremea]QDU96481.1 Trehalose utilization [Lignipirellula cremea]